MDRACIDPDGVPAASAVPSDAVPAQPRDTHFDFRHKVFTMPGAVFTRAADSQEPILNVLLGELKASLGFVTLMDAFGLEEEGHDALLLQQVEQGLLYVKAIRPGEKIPNELLDGTASWAVEERHRIVARGRLTLQIVAWITGEETIVADLDALGAVVDDPQTKARLRAAYNEIAAKLGYGDDFEQKINDRLDDLVQELSYIEALRDRFKVIRGIGDKLTRMTALYRTDRVLAAEVARMHGLLKKPLSYYDAMFEQADAQTGEVLGALRAFPTTVEFIRTTRDQLRQRLLDWEELLQSWNAAALERGPALEQLQKRTYRYLAQRFLDTQVWQRRA